MTETEERLVDRFAACMDRYYATGDPKWLLAAARTERLRKRAANPNR